ncbi:sodium-independent sulfate anion transporter-like isoform X2 [Euwallacea fornicatus]|uniref:sodium-independent sulfate anion transporter-like isoform X2 n=1 Tax=Euwallacea fornicatus TaxID=995702 RepID=UPI00338FAC90
MRKRSTKELQPELGTEDQKKVFRNTISVDNWSPSKRNKIDWSTRIKNRIPIIKWLPTYTLSFFLHDFLAGLTVALTAIPQGIAYAVVAGLPSQYGLYSGIMGGVFYFIFGGCKDINVGPTAIMALLVQPKVATMGPDGAVLITFLSGFFLFAAGILHLGFTTAAALNIACAQLKSLLGIPGPANQFLEAWKSFFTNVHQIKLWDSVLGTTTIIFVFALRELRRLGSMEFKPQWSKNRNIIGRAIFFISLGSNAFAGVAGGSIAFIAEKYYNASPVAITGDVDQGFPPLSLPPFSTNWNGTHFSFPDMLAQYGTLLAFCPLVAFLEHIAIVKAFSKGKTIDATQELLASGMGNMAGSLLRSMPMTGSFTRTALNNASGVRTPASGLITSILVIAALTLLTGIFKYIPKSTLAAVIMVSMYYLCEFHVIRVMWRTKKLDLIPFFVTLMSSLFLSLEYGMIIGIATNLLFILYDSARPKLYFERITLETQTVYMIRPKGSLFFPSAEYLRDEILRVCCEEKSTIVLDGEYVRTVDATHAKGFGQLLDDLDARNQRFLLWNFNESVTEICTGDNKKLVTYFKNGDFDLVIQGYARRDSFIPNSGEP